MRPGAASSTPADRVRPGSTGPGGSANAAAATVTCNATDVAGNSAPQVTFLVMVLSAAEQLGALHAQVIGVGPGTSLADAVTSVESYLATNHKSNACGTLGAFINEVNAVSGKKIAKPLASQLVT